MCIYTKGPASSGVQNILPPESNEITHRSFWIYYVASDKQFAPVASSLRFGYLCDEALPNSTIRNSYVAQMEYFKLITIWTWSSDGISHFRYTIRIEYFIDFQTDIHLLTRFQIYPKWDTMLLQKHRIAPTALLLSTEIGLKPMWCNMLVLFRCVFHNILHSYNVLYIQHPSTTPPSIAACSSLQHASVVLSLSISFRCRPFTRRI